VTIDHVMIFGAAITGFVIISLALETLAATPRPKQEARDEGDVGPYKDISR
jgi:hypothetical protein